MRNVSTSIKTLQQRKSNEHMEGNNGQVCEMKNCEIGENGSWSGFPIDSVVTQIGSERNDLHVTAVRCLLLPSFIFSLRSKKFTIISNFTFTSPYFSSTSKVCRLLKYSLALSMTSRFKICNENWFAIVLICNCNVGLFLSVILKLTINKWKSRKVETSDYKTMRKPHFPSRALRQINYRTAKCKLHRWQEKADQRLLSTFPETIYSARAI